MMHLSLSTSWNSYRHDNGRDLINEIKALGLDTVELNFSLSEKVVNDVLEIYKNGGIKVSSLHNMCPLPQEIKPANASPDHYSLASPDDEERKIAVSIAKNTIDYANKFSAKAVVIHAGRVEMREGMRELSELMPAREHFESFRNELIRERTSKRETYIDSVTKSLADLIPYAKDKCVMLGLENRYYYREIPLLDEFEMLFKIFPPGSLYYWHDTGHAEVFDRLGFYRHTALLEKFSSRLLGLHMHDIIGTVDDHKAPGFGTFDFNIIKPYLTKDIIKVLEVHKPVTAGEIRQGIEYLDKILG